MPRRKINSSTDIIGSVLYFSTFKSYLLFCRDETDRVNRNKMDEKNK